jgi:hypothetical protein
VWTRPLCNQHLLVFALSRCSRTAFSLSFCACMQAFKRRGKALGWLAALLAMYPGGPLLKPKGGGGLAAIARQRKLPVGLVSQQHFGACTARPSRQQLDRKLKVLHAIGAEADRQVDMMLAP